MDVNHADVISNILRKHSFLHEFPVVHTNSLVNTVLPLLSGPLGTLDPSPDGRGSG